MYVFIFRTNLSPNNNRTLLTQPDKSDLLRTPDTGYEVRSGLQNVFAHEPTHKHTYTHTHMNAFKIFIQRMLTPYMQCRN